MDPYDVLGVSADASTKDIRRAYLAMARRHHPDSYVSASAAEQATAETKMREVNQAWAVLGDAAARADHDKATTASASFTGSASGPPRAHRFDEPFVPYDHRDDPPMPAEDVGRATGFARWMATAPVFLFGTAFVLLILGSMTNIAPLLALSVVCFLGAIGGFLVAPLVALAASARADKQG